MADARLLVVDDDTDLADSLAELLEVHGFATGVVYSGEAALLELARRPYDLALVDVGLPGMTGVDLARTVVDEFPALRVLLMSGHAASESELRGTPARLADVLAKPIRIDTLLSALRHGPG